MSSVTVPDLEIIGVVTRGYGVASGVACDPRFPQGTLREQMPHFKALGLDLSLCYPGTINLDISPYRLVPGKFDYRFEQLKWSPASPAETFSFCACRIRYGKTEEAGWIYYPHPETKPEHFHDASIVEVLAPWIAGLRYGAVARMVIEASRVTPVRAYESRLI